MNSLLHPKYHVFFSTNKNLPEPTVQITKLPDMTLALRLLIRLVLLLIVVLFMLFVWFRFFKNDEKTAEPLVNHNTVLQEITAMGKLELVRYAFKDVVEYEQPQTSNEMINRFLPNAKTVLIVSGEAVGCLDLTKIQQSDVTEDKDTIIVYLPEPEMCYYRIDHSKSKVWDTKNGYFVETGNLVNEAFKAAETQIRQSALDMGILAETNKNAEKILLPTLEKISGKKVLLRRRLSGNLNDRKK